MFLSSLCMYSLYTSIHQFILDVPLSLFIWLQCHYKYPLKHCYCLLICRIKYLPCHYKCCIKCVFYHHMCCIKCLVYKCQKQAYCPCVYGRTNNQAIMQKNTIFISNQNWLWIFKLRLWAIPKSVRMSICLSVATPSKKEARRLASQSTLWMLI